MEKSLIFAIGVQENLNLAVSRDRTKRTCELERRTTVRYRLGAPAVFSWKAQNGNRLQGEGFTRDMNLKGAFILTHTCPPEGIQVSIDIFLPPLNKSRHSVRLITEGQVIRVEHADSGARRDGFAVVSQGFAIPELTGEGD